MKLKKSILSVSVLFIVLFATLFFYNYLWRKPISIAGKETRSPANHMATKNAGLLPFAVDMAKAEHDPYFGPAVLYDPNDSMMAQMRLWMLGFASAMDNPKHPCNPLVTTNTQIIGINIRPLPHGDKVYTMWFSDGKTICGMEAARFGNWSGATFEGDFFQELYVREMAPGFGYASKDEADEIISKNKKSFWKEDIGETAHDMVVNALGADFLNGTLPQQYDGFFVSDSDYSGNYTADGYQHWFFTPNIVEASLKRDDVPPYNTFYVNKFQAIIQAEPTNSLLAFKVVYVTAYNNGFDFSKRQNAAKAIQLR